MTLLRCISNSLSRVLPILLTVFVCTNALAKSNSEQGNTSANDNLPEPHRVIQDITNRLLLIINDGKLNPATSSDEFYNSAVAILEPVVAFDYIAKGVMGDYADKATPEQLQRFTEAFKKGLVNTYSKGLTDFSDSVDITILQPEAETADQNKVSVIQKVINRGATTYISYTMAQGREKQWKIVNVVLNGVNLGKTFRGQFAQAVQKNQGNVIKVIDEWGKDS
jgi:phospholipid transport system substrate-binding protein